MNQETANKILRSTGMRVSEMPLTEVPQGKWVWHRAVVTGLALVIGLGAYQGCGTTRTEPVQRAAITSQIVYPPIDTIMQNSIMPCKATDKIYVGAKGIEFSADGKEYVSAYFSEHTPLADLRKALKGTSLDVIMSEEGFAVLDISSGRWFSFVNPSVRTLERVLTPENATTYHQPPSGELIKTPEDILYDYDLDGHIDGWLSEAKGTRIKEIQALADKTKQDLLVDKVKVVYNTLEFVRE